MSGIAKDANLYSVRVIGSYPGGSVSTVIAGLNYIGEAHSEKSKR